VNKLNDHLYEVDELVIGSSLEAVSYSFLNHRTLIMSGFHRLNFFDFFSRGNDLTKYGIDTEEYELKTPDGSKKFGPSKLEIWEQLVFSLSISGLLPVHDLASSIRIEDENILKVFTKNSRMIKFKFKKLRIFNHENVYGLEMISEGEEYKVIDWVNVRSGTKHEYDYIETNDDFVKEIYFYSSQRLGAGDNDKRKDLVSVSYLNKDQLEDFNYSDTYVIKGARNGKRHDDSSKYAYHSIKLEPNKREIIKLTKLVHANKKSFIFDSRGEREIYSESSLQDGYLYKVHNSLR